VGAAELDKMKPTALLINASRGPIVEEEALISALKNKQIAGAAIDVFDIEPLAPTHPSGRWRTYWQRRISATYRRVFTRRSMKTLSRISASGSTLINVSMLSRHRSRLEPRMVQSCDLKQTSQSNASHLS
jgi:lactate dehydrogenase-like 2-hydroxyacid dehydrogenase